MAQIVMTSDPKTQSRAPYVSMAIFAWNEERAISSVLESLLNQSIFAELRQRGEHCEVICVANGCTDQTPAVAAEILRDVTQKHPDRDCLVTRVANITERGKVNAWNQFVHHVSAPSAHFLFMMDADILIHRKETLGNMLRALEQDAEATVAVDVPRKHLFYEKRKSFASRLSLAASSMTLSADGQLCGQLYCIRAEAARRIFLPKDLAACEDGFIKSVVSTDFLAHTPEPRRIRVAENAEHTFEAYTTPKAVLKNQKRQVMGQTIVHVLVDHYLKSFPAAQRQNLGELLRNKDATDPAWLKRLISEHLARTPYFWRLYPDLLGNRFARLRKLNPVQRLRCLPAALAASCATLAASFLAYRSLKRGCTDYWPKAQRAGLQRAGRLEDTSGAPSGFGVPGLPGRGTEAARRRVKAQLLAHATPPKGGTPNPSHL